MQQTLRWSDGSFDNMVQMTTYKGFTFPYLHDEDQLTAPAYVVTCTSVFLTSSIKGSCSAAAQIAKTSKGLKSQIAFVECSIKWKDA